MTPQEGFPGPQRIRLARSVVVSVGYHDLLAVVAPSVVLEGLILSPFVQVIELLFLLYPLIPQIHHTIVVGLAFNQSKGGFYGNRDKERFTITDHQGMNQHIDSVPQVIFQK